MFMFRGQSPSQAAALVQAAQVGLGLQNALAPGDKGGTHRLAAQILGRGFPVATKVWIARYQHLPGCLEDAPQLLP